MSPGAEASPLEPDHFRLLFEQEAARFGLQFEELPGALSRFLSELDRWRRRINLTGPMQSEALVGHALESALGIRLIIDAKRVLDIGSGAGFPGIPIAICRPDLSVTLLEPREKRAAFLRHAIRDVPIENANVSRERLESVTDVFDAATVRAVGRVSEAIGAAKFLKEGGRLLTWTTDVPGLEAFLSVFFELEQVLPVPGSSRRKIARFRRRVPRRTHRGNRLSGGRAGG